MDNPTLVADSKPSMEIRSLERPRPGPNEVLVKVFYAAQNPTDVQSFDLAAFGDGAVYGCDFAGKVIELGEKVSRLAVGDMIAGLVWGGEIEGLGAYANYTLADERIAFKLPPSVTVAAASTIPLALTTSWLALFSKDCLNINRAGKGTVLIWGGSSSVGQFAIQIAALHSLVIITTCSPKNFDLVKGLGASHVFDYRSPGVSDEIRNVAPDVKYVFDTIGNADSSAIACAAALPDCTLCTVRPGKKNTDDVPKTVKVTDVFVWTAFLKDHYYGKFHWPPSEADHQLSAELFENLPRWIEDGKIKPNDVHLLKGLQSVPQGFQLYRDGKISARKVVYEVD